MSSPDLGTAAASIVAVVVAEEWSAQRAAAELLSESGILVVTPSSETELLRRRADAAEIVVLLPRADAAARIGRIVETAAVHPGAPLVAAMPADAPATVLRRALRSGADGIVLEDELERTLVPTVRAVVAGQLAMPQSFRRQIARRPLSYREKQILNLVVLGYTNRQIADTLFVAESTVKTHLSSAFDKLGTRSRAEAAALILDPDEGVGLGILSIAVAPGRAA